VILREETGRGADRFSVLGLVGQLVPETGNMSSITALLPLRKYCTQRTVLVAHSLIDMAFRPTKRSLETSVRMSLDTWAFRSTCEYPVDLMILTRSAEQCDTQLENQSSSLLMCLPIEIILMVGTFLEPIDAVCFTLSCKRAACALGLKSWGKFRLINTTSDDRWDLLQRLKRDLPNYHRCYYLNKLIRMSDPVVTEDFHMRKPPKCSRRYRVPDNPGCKNDYMPSFCDVQLLMERHMHGPPHGLSLEDFAISTPWSCLTDLKDPLHHYSNYYLAGQSEPQFWKLSMTLQIIQDNLLLHTVERCVAPKVVKPSPAQRSVSWFSFGRNICQHLEHRFDSTEEVRMANRQLDRLIHEATFTSWQSASMKCYKCPTEFRLAAFNLPRHNAVELVVRCVQNLGRCQSSFQPGSADGYPIYYRPIPHSNSRFDDPWYYPTSLPVVTNLAPFIEMSTDMSEVDESVLLRLKTRQPEKPPPGSSYGSYQVKQRFGRAVSFWQRTRSLARFR
jgi:hypothetical protein